MKNWPYLENGERYD